MNKWLLVLIGVRIALEVYNRKLGRDFDNAIDELAKKGQNNADQIVERK